ncbi:MAG: 2-oxoacid:ferredoxin oxidoreductase subunit beta [Candidatus Heimdallarchaeota archaeon]|nr:2-oxoacid:ferredoxin oxidoreductase subunit beta [Candidatus Heimdallarchaeota archaeon]MCK4253296.1 2-oxoacid:ferredoxin oxidoreductase subunit beta [Candidatus Heimdallarchaeota archaeon]
MTEEEIGLLEAEEHPLDKYLRKGRIPHIWCPGCSLGSVMTVIIEAIKETGIDPKNISVISGIGCTGRTAGYLNFDSFHTTHGRAIPFAIGLGLTDPNRKVIVISGDGDLASIGGNHLIHAARRNADITVICVNNFQYGMTGGQVGPTSYKGQVQTTAPYSNIEEPFNLPELVKSCGATYVARWTALDVRRVKESFVEAINHKGFSFVEILGACPTTYGRRNQLREGIAILENFKERSVIEHGIDTEKVAIGKEGPIIVGKFVDIHEKPTLTDNLFSIQRIATASKDKGA